MWSSCTKAVAAISLAALTTSVGCQSKGEDPIPTTRDAAAALAFDVPAVYASADERDEVRTFLNARLARAGRAETALLGYDSPTVTFFAREIDDRQRITSGYGSFGGGYFGHGFGGFGVHGGRVLDHYRQHDRSVSTFQRTRPAGELN